MRRSRIALILTVKNERDLLRSNIIYHYYLGVSLFFVFLDGTTDGTAETVRDLPFVRIAPSVEAARYSHRPELDKFCRIASTHHDARQCLNTFAALEKAREEGFDWLINLDADELICLNTYECYPGHLQDFFDAAPMQVEAVRFPPLEVVPRRVE